MQQSGTAERMQGDDRGSVHDDGCVVIARGEKEKAAPSFLEECPPIGSTPAGQIRILCTVRLLAWTDAYSVKL